MPTIRPFLLAHSKIHLSLRLIHPNIQVLRVTNNQPHSKDEV